MVTIISSTQDLFQLMERVEVDSIKLYVDDELIDLITFIADTPQGYLLYGTEDAVYNANDFKEVRYKVTF